MAFGHLVVGFVKHATARLVFVAYCIDGEILLSLHYSISLSLAICIPNHERLYMPLCRGGSHKRGSLVQS